MRKSQQSYDLLVVFSICFLLVACLFLVGGIELVVLGAAGRVGQ